MGSEGESLSDEGTWLSRIRPPPSPLGRRGPSGREFRKGEEGPSGTGAEQGPGHGRLSEPPPGGQWR